MQLQDEDEEEKFELRDSRRPGGVRLQHRAVAVLRRMGRVCCGGAGCSVGM